MPFEEGHNLATGRPKGSKNKTTLDKEQRRILFEELVSDKFEKLVEKAKPEYLLDQFMGKATDKHEHKLNFTFDEDPVEPMVEKVE